MNYTIKYGTLNSSINITEIVLKKCLKQDIIFIPDNDHTRASLFTDPVFGMHKKIYIVNNTTHEQYEYDETQYIYIDIK